MIKLSITRFQPDEKYREKLAEYELHGKNFPYNNNREIPRPNPEQVSSMLDVEIKEEQWEAIRKAVLERF